MSCRQPPERGAASTPMAGNGLRSRSTQGEGSRLPDSDFAIQTASNRVLSEWKEAEPPPMQNSPGIPLASLVAAIALVIVTAVSGMAGVGRDPALTELQIGATVWALALGIFGVQGLVSIIVEGRQVVPGINKPRLNNSLSAVIAAASILLFMLAGLTGLAIVSGQSTAVIGTVAGAGCVDLGLLLLFYKEAFIGHEAHLDVRHDGVPW